MKKKNNHTIHLLIMALVNTFSFAATIPEPPPPLKRAVPPGLPIDEHLLVFIILTILLSFYFFRKSIKKAPKV
ncbi:hypothetical protein B0A78_07440 [Flavobacterium columnare NBRC 100251 = ATCC 23463]|uniref:Signal peptidase n=2 Tax=Flavobacterium columnare TaxID=996 RepID=G8X516_FLACA|nr:hypothetical protein [Flavobacterium columnare]PDS24099.1 hypothetical protein B0A78_07440 [Flavobacterium columnare NBRC 100251 = ATCC 23463]AEW86832.1 hypothetical protein FCOL_10115 [Flavobacterium columnare ATCC 49512]AMO20751.1 hypothetical protein UN65_10765 [Flavobacterium columnare]APT22076.1 hypothetical protein BU993_05165 [Flavobacterium columnare]AUX18734.1 hypothetical protein AQ623_10920 [Flavobacterium columnare]